MNILDFAMKMEMDGKRFYQNAAAKESNRGLKEILTMLADEEQNHYEFFAKMKGNELEAAGDLLNSNSDTLRKTSNLFQELSKTGAAETFGDDTLSVWTEALHIEEKAEKFYRDKASEESDPQRRELLNRIADEERNHVMMIDGVLTYLKFPEEFAQSAQFKDFQSLEGR